MIIETPPYSFTTDQKDYLMRMFKTMIDDNKGILVPKTGVLPTSYAEGRVFYFTQIIGTTIHSNKFLYTRAFMRVCEPRRGDVH